MIARNHPVTYDSLELNTQREKVDLAQLENKIIEREFKAVKMAIQDSYLHTLDGMKELVSDFADMDEYIIHFSKYLKARDLFLACTKKQQEVLYLLISKRMRVYQACRVLEIKRQTIESHIKSIGLKAKKLNIKLNGDEQTNVSIPDSPIIQS